MREHSPTLHEADVLITVKGPRNLTEGLFEMPDVITG
jgi:hypothetical protein